MILLPAIDLFGGKAVRLYKGDYAQMTVYSERPMEVAQDFAACGAEWIHMVDLEGARSGGTPNVETISRIVRETGLRAEVGGGVRSMEVVERYVEAGVSRVVIGTAAVTDPSFLAEAVRAFGEKIAVGVDLRDGFVAIRGWTEKTALAALDFCRRMEDAGVKTIVCTDISRDGAMRGANRGLYRELSAAVGMEIVASGGVSSLEDVRALREAGLYGAILGKAYYTGAVDLRAALEAAQ